MSVIWALTWPRVVVLRCAALHEPLASNEILCNNGRSSRPAGRSPVSPTVWEVPVSVWKNATRRWHDSPSTPESFVMVTCCVFAGRKPGCQLTRGPSSQGFNFRHGYRPDRCCRPGRGYRPVSPAASRYRQLHRNCRQAGLSQAGAERRRGDVGPGSRLGQLAASNRAAYYRS
jgi:hypothetical protein